MNMLLQDLTGYTNTWMQFMFSLYSYRVYRNIAEELIMFAIEDNKFFFFTLPLVIYIARATFLI